MMGPSPPLQVNSVNCNTSWKINLFMQFRDHLEEVLKGVRTRHLPPCGPAATFPAPLPVGPRLALCPLQLPPTPPPRRHRRVAPSLVSASQPPTRSWLVSLGSPAKGVSVGWGSPSPPWGGGNPLSTLPLPTACSMVPGQAPFPLPCALLGKAAESGPVSGGEGTGPWGTAPRETPWWRVCRDWSGSGRRAGETGGDPENQAWMREGFRGPSGGAAGFGTSRLGCRQCMERRHGEEKGRLLRWRNWQVRGWGAC